MTRGTEDDTDGINRRRFLAGGAAVAGLGLAPLGLATQAGAAVATPGATGQAGAAGSGAGALPATSGQPSGLLTSLLDDPLGVPVTGMRMSWIVPALGVAPMQNAYQIQLAGSPDALVSSPGALVWDSGQVTGSQSTAVSYTGPALQPATPYWWRVRTWVSTGGAGGQVSAWSAPQRIVTEAGSDPAQWAGIPVWVPADTTGSEPDDWALLRTEFTLPDKPVRCAFVQATAQSPEGARQYVYKLWCNAAVAGRGPVRSMGTEARYHTHDVTALLRPGPNALAALCYTASGHQFQAQAVVVFTDGSRQVVGTSDQWRAMGGAKMLPPNGFTGGGYFNDPQEYWDMRQEPAGWTQPGFDDSTWLSAAPGAGLPSLAPATVNVGQYLIQPASITQVAPGQWLVDLGKEVAGGLHLRVNGTAGDTITVQLGEQLDGTTVVYHLLAGNTYSEVWTLRDGWQDIEHWGYRGFRWAQLITTDTSLDLSQAVRGVALHMAWHDGDSSFDCSNADLTRVWEFARYSIKATSLDVYQDTPTRERDPYEGDALIDQASQYSVQRSYGLARYSNSYLCRRPTWPAEYHLMSVLSAWQDYLATGDSDHFATDYSYYVAKNFDADLGSDGLVHKAPGSSSQYNADLVDWPVSERDGYVFTDVNTVINSFQYAAYATLAQVAGVLGNTADEAKYTGLASQVRTAINTRLLPAGSGAYIDGEGTTHTALHATAFPVALGVPDAADLPALGQFLAASGMACSVYAAQFLLEALFASGQADAAHALLTATGLSSWLHMMDDLHATITMEAWDPSIKPNTTFSHAWGTAPANIVPRQILGVQVTAPGAAELTVRPQPGPLTWMTGTVPTIRGPVRVSVDRRAGLRAVVTLPPNTTGRIEIDTAAFGVAAGSLRVTSDAQPKPAVSTDGATATVTGALPGATTITGG